MVHSPAGSQQAAVSSQESVLGSVLLNVFINNVCDGTESTVSRFVDNSKLGRVVDNAEELGSYSEGPEYLS